MSQLEAQPARLSSHEFENFPFYPISQKRLNRVGQVTLNIVSTQKDQLDQLRTSEQFTIVRRSKQL